MTTKQPANISTKRLVEIIKNIARDKNVGVTEQWIQKSIGKY